MLNEIYIIRHGHPQLGTGIPYDRVPGPPLSDIGREEAHLAGIYLVNRGIERVYVSPLERTLGTGRIVVAELDHVPMIIDEGLAEHRSGESFDTVKGRLGDFVARVESEPLSCVAFVTHGSPMKALLQNLTDNTIDLSKYVYPNGNHAPTAGVWYAHHDLLGHWHLNLVFKPVITAPAAHVPV